MTCNIQNWLIDFYIHCAGMTNNNRFWMIDWMAWWHDYLTNNNKQYMIDWLEWPAITRIGYGIITWLPTCLPLWTWHVGDDPSCCGRGAHCPSTPWLLLPLWLRILCHKENKYFFKSLLSCSPHNHFRHEGVRGTDTVCKKHQRECKQFLLHCSCNQRPAKFLILTLWCVIQSITF